MNVNDKFPLDTLKPQLRIDARIISALERGSSGAPFLATVLLVRTLAHAIGKRHHIGYPLRSHCYVQRGVTDNSPADYGNYPPETAFFGGIVGVVFRSGTATDPQLLDIAYFMIRFPSGKIYKFDVDRAVNSSPFPVEGLEEVNMASQDFFSHTCECFIRDRQYSTS
ncbi:uncharacterized protein ARMOST_20754 [Armillaria ostoyae]|uniref:Uncharacterized protein n=1 Tax=Armillaria ostoyae TaxID=47428 RepID=A0A284S886_ARMOS|nr:uncharacterized protein ARMOST_20754 [Armillaria ostoyae]